MVESATISMDTIYKRALEESQVKSANDAIVLALHASLLAEEFDCIATTEEGFESCADNISETKPVATPTNPSLPKGWNDFQDVYVLQYHQRHRKRVCLIKILPLGDQLLINAISSDKLSNVITLSLPVTLYTKERQSDQPIMTMSNLKNVLQLFSTLNKEITMKLKIEKEEEQTKQTKKEDDPFSINPPQIDTDISSIRIEHDEDEEKQPRRRRDPPRMSGEHQPIHLVEPMRGDIDPFGLGAGDLSPFGGPGGMIMDPLRERRRFGPGIGPRPPVFHPPGARFDPISPFEPRFHPGRGGPGRFGGRGGGGAMYGPDPDHLPPPGYDDMFS